MERALAHAERARGRTIPNPAVGAVVVTPEGVVVGAGSTCPPGGPHAEIVALDRAGARAKGGTLYCTLEPCCHVGRTGPCVERIEAAGIARVVAAMTDPNPRVSGRGFSHLRAHRIEVTVGVGRAQAARQLAAFTTWITRQRPLVTLKSVQSRDGFVGRRGSTIRLTGPEADRFFHRQRAEIDAMAVGSATVLEDDPLLTPRGAYRSRPLTRIVFDWRGRVPLERRLFSTLDAGPVIMVVAEGEQADGGRRAARFEAAGVTVTPFPAHDVDAVVAWLADREIQWLLVEGGPRLHEAFVRAGLADRAQIVVTPDTLSTGVPAAVGPDVIDPRSLQRRRLGRDELMEGDVHRAD
jgi:diaminohydroxyphosphoribosylaminopyrimidine deaminase/5-amino-6-(5-phosphoribosylamino)uracil reductase